MSLLIMLVSAAAIIALVRFGVVAGWATWLAPSLTGYMTNADRAVAGVGFEPTSFGL